MADARITELPAASPVTGAEQVPMAQSGVTVRLSLQDVPVSIPVKTALDGKSDTGHTHSNATQSVAGFMSAADKVVVDEVLTPPASNTPVNNGEMAFELTDNTTLTIRVKGTDGTVRSVALTLA